jgi:hypothetical protein
MERLAYFIGPNGNVVTIADLPSPMTTRWVIRRKAEIVLAVPGECSASMKPARGMI